MLMYSMYPNKNLVYGRGRGGKPMLREVYELPANRSIQVVFNDWGQPVGYHANLLATWCGIIIRANCPFNYSSWHKVPSTTKTLLVNLSRKI